MDPTQNRPMEHSLCNINPPFMQPSKIFKTLTCTEVTQSINPIRVIGQYYRRFVPDESEACRRGERLEARNHIIQECSLYDEWGNFLRDDEDVFKIADLFESAEGSQRIAKFIESSGA